MKQKTLTVMLVLAVASLASATTVSMIAPEEGAAGSATNPLAASQTLRVYLGVDAADLDTLIATISATNATINGGILAAEALNYGLGVTDYGVVMVPTLSTGWQSDLSFDTAVIGGNAHIGLGHAGNLISGPTSIPALAPPLVGGELGGAMAIGSTPIAYIDLTAAGTGNILLSIVDGSTYGSGSILTDFSTPDFAGTTIFAVPEPTTMVLLSLGGLLLRRKK